MLLNSPHTCSPFRITGGARHVATVTARAAMRTSSHPGTLSLEKVPQHYKGVLLDQFGVLHDGTKPYPGAVEAVEFLASNGVALLIISNSSRRSSQALSNIARMGFPPSCFAGVVTSGEVTHTHLRDRPSPFWQDLGHRCLHFTWGARGAISLEGLGLQVTQDPDAADFILAHGTEALGGPAGGNGSETPSSAAQQGGSPKGVTMTSAYKAAAGRTAGTAAARRAG